MISDTLSDARAELERYRLGYPCYEGMGEEIAVVEAVMANLQARLDMPPTAIEAPAPLLWADIPARLNPNTTPNTDPTLTKLRAAMRHLSGTLFTGGESKAAEAEYEAVAREAVVYILGTRFGLLEQDLNAALLSVEHKGATG
jgi:hypothetical protein